MTSTREQLKEAYRLIRQDQPEAAQEIIRPILAEDPENVHAWWLLAYSVDDPYEVRDALNKVLELDPDYSNAPKAREMLQTLDQQFFAAQAEADPADSTYAAGDLETEPAGESADSFLDGTFDYDVVETDTDTLPEDETFLAGYDEASFDAETTDEDVYIVEEDFDTPEDDALEDLFTVPEDVELADEERARAEERAGARSGRGRRMLTALMVFAVLVLVLLAAFLLLQEDESDDPETLAAVDASEPVGNTLAAARDDVAAAGVGAEQDVLIAETSAGETLFVEFCREPSRELPQDIAFAMQIAVQHAVDIADAIDAVGVSVNRCGADDQDTLYRAFVPVEDALAYVNGELGSAETAWPVFQSRWQKP